MNCWGWATWANRWKHFEKDIGKTMKEFSKEDIKRFNLDGAENFFGQVVSNYENKINTWAIFWYAIIFKKHGLCLNPTQTFVENIGHDGSGVHCGDKKSFVDILNHNENIKYISEVIENKDAVLRIKKTMKKNILQRIKRLIIWK